MKLTAAQVEELMAKAYASHEDRIMKIEQDWEDAQAQYNRAQEIRSKAIKDSYEVYADFIFQAYKLMEKNIPSE